ncbi:MAG: hypothetical protein ACKON9_08715, partial [Planctomycetaceae bacterium]
EQLFAGNERLVEGDQIGCGHERRQTHQCHAAAAEPQTVVRNLSRTRKFPGATSNLVGKLRSGKEKVAEPPENHDLEVLQTA